MAPASVAISLSFRFFLPPRPLRGNARWPRPIRAMASSDTSGLAGGERKVGALERRVGDLRALVASVPPAVASVTTPLSFPPLGVYVYLDCHCELVIDAERCWPSSTSMAGCIERPKLKKKNRKCNLLQFDFPCFSVLDPPFLLQQTLSTSVNRLNCVALVFCNH